MASQITVFPALSPSRLCSGLRNMRGGSLNAFDTKFSDFKAKIAKNPNLEASRCEILRLDVSVRRDSHTLDPPPLDTASETPCVP